MADFSPAVNVRPDAVQRLAARWANGPAPLPWTETALDLVVKYQENRLRAARVLAHLHAAANDAVIDLAGTTTDPFAQAVAVHAAASAVLTHFYPEESPGRLGAMRRGAAMASASKVQGPEVDVDEAWRVGDRAAQRAVARALNDGADAIWNLSERPTPAPGIWRAAPPLNLLNPTEPRAGNWKTWAVRDEGEIQPPPPLPFGSERYWKEAQEVLDVSRALTAGQKRIANEWNLDKGSVMPPGCGTARRWIWRRRAAWAPRMLAALNVAMSDALVACWRAKFEHWTLRPVSAIRDKLDPEFLPYLFTPPFPGYVSGHAVASGAAAEVLAGFFPDRAGELQAWAE